jgi:hypothetical protein
MDEIKEYKLLNEFGADAGPKALMTIRQAAKANARITNSGGRSMLSDAKLYKWVPADDEGLWAYFATEAAVLRSSIKAYETDPDMSRLWNLTVAELRWVEQQMKKLEAKMQWKEQGVSND